MTDSTEKEARLSWGDRIGIGLIVYLAVIGLIAHGVGIASGIKTITPYLFAQASDKVETPLPKSDRLDVEPSGISINQKKADAPTLTSLGIESERKQPFMSAYPFPKDTRRR